ncbi:MAG: creatininase family protein [Chloroflexi bacterium]|nr:creatininase family protein [Chloroflexota bacterium]
MEEHWRSPEHEYLYLTSQEVGRQAIGFLPVGSLETHGAALPLGTDVLIAEAFARTFARRVTGVVLPALPYGFSPNTAGLPGTVSPTGEVLVAYLKELCLSLQQNACARLIVLSIHKGNDAVIRVVVDDLFHSHGISVFYVNPYSFMGEAIDRELFAGRDNSYKEGCLLLASLRILNDQHVSRYTCDENTAAPHHPDLQMLRHHGSLGFSYPDEESHVGSRRDLDVEGGLRFFKLAEDQMAELVTAWSNLGP